MLDTGARGGGEFDGSDGGDSAVRHSSGAVLGRDLQWYHLSPQFVNSDQVFPVLFKYVIVI